MGTPWTEHDDAQLMRAARRDASAFGELYRRHVGAVHAWFAHRVAWAAADLTAETFARAWISRAGFRDERDGSALPWLLGVGRNVLRESARRDRVETRARERLGLPLAIAPEEGYAAVDERLSPRRSLAAALAALPAHERQALELRIVEELPYGRVAEVLQIRPTAARVRVSRAIRRLAETTTEDET
jgi:RNA polymerase sigma factor (sigma-70 family)